MHMKSIGSFLDLLEHLFLAAEFDTKSCRLRIPARSVFDSDQFQIFDALGSKLNSKAF